MWYKALIGSRSNRGTIALPVRDWQGLAVTAGVFLLPLACWADLPQPFSLPKTWLLAGIALAVAAGWAAHRPLRLPEWPWLIWIAAVSLSAALAPYVSLGALLLALLPLAPAVAIASGWIPAQGIARALVWGSACESAVVCLQWLYVDPLRWLGWHPEAFPGRRMRAYGTLGNPDFVAAWLCGTLPLTVGYAIRQPRRGWPLVALQVAALAATGSRAAALGVAAMAVVFAVMDARVRRLWPAAVLAAVLAAAAVLWLSPGRPLARTIEGRLYLASVATLHWEQTPVIGYGPGAFPLLFAQWQVEWFRTRGVADPTERFAGPVDHAHNDYLEFLIEYGAAGLCAFVGVSSWLMVSAWRRRRAGPLAPWTAPAWAGVAGLLAIALVDFPLHRPAEWCLYWLLLAMIRAER